MKYSVLRFASVVRAAAMFAMLVPVAAMAQQTVVADGRPDRNRYEDELLGRLVTLQLDAVPLRSAVAALGKIAKVRVQYRIELLDAVVEPVTLHAKQLPLRAALDRVLEGTRLQAVVLDQDLIVIRPAATTNQATDGVITGTVTDATTKRAVPGVVVTLQEAKLSVRTGDDGVYRFTGVANGTYTLVVRRLGYAAKRRTVTVTDETTPRIDMVMSPSATPLQEVVTTVTGPQRRVELGNVVSVINADSLVKEAPIFTVSQLLSSRVPGLIAAQSQGTVGGDVTLKIRSLGSLSLSTEPIVIVDGIRYSSQAVRGIADNRREAVSPLNDLNPNDIETVEVVKGPSAATLYGTDASNGVIVITTKRGKPGATKWSAFATRLTNEIPRPRNTNARRVYFGWKTDPETGFVSNDCRIQYLCIPDSVTAQPSVSGNDALSILQSAPGSWTSGVSVSGGQSALRYFLSGTYDDQTAGIGIPDTVRKLVQAKLGVAKLPDSFLRPNTQTLFNVRSNVVASLGTRGDVTVSTGYTRGETRSIESNFQPFIAALTQSNSPDYNIEVTSNVLAKSSTENNDRFVSSINGQGQLASWLTVRGTVGLDAAIRSRHELASRDSTRYLDPTGFVFEGRTRQMATTGDAGITLTFQRGWASLRTSLGTQYIRSMSDVITSKGYNLGPGSTSIAFAEVTSSAQQHDESVTLGSYIEEALSLGDRLFLTGAVRVDGASGFGSGYSSAAYPKIGMSWLVTQEPWIPRISWINEFRVRAALGASGRQAPPTYQLPGWYIGPPFSIFETGQYLDLGDIGNANLRPEKAREFETGIDIGLLDRRADIELTWSNRRTKDLIIYQQLLPGYGYTYRNIALASGRAFEARTTLQVLDTRLFSLGLTLQHSEQGTKLLKLGDATPNLNPGGGYAEGYPLGARFTRPLLGYNDANGDGIIVESEVQYGPERTYTGPNAPTRTQQLTTNVGFFAQRLRFSALFDREAGGTMLLEMYCSRCREAFDRTTPLAEQALHVARFSNPAVSGTFTRLREITAALTIPQRLVRALRVSSGTVSLSARNLALWTHYSGAGGDPESSPIIGLYYPYARENATGIPQSRTWVTRFDLGL